MNDDLGFVADVAPDDLGFVAEDDGLPADMSARQRQQLELASEMAAVRAEAEPLDRANAFWNFRAIPFSRTTPDQLAQQHRQALALRPEGERLGIIQTPGQGQPFAPGGTRVPRVVAGVPPTTSLTPIPDAEPPPTPPIPDAIAFQTALVNELGDAASSFTSAENLAILAGTFGVGAVGKAGQILQRAVAGTFGVEGVKGIKAAAEELKGAKTPEEKGGAWGKLLANTALLPGIPHAVKGLQLPGSTRAPRVSEAPSPNVPKVPGESPGTARVARALPETEILTDQQKFVRENFDAMRAMREQKELTAAIDVVRERLLAEQEIKFVPDEPAPVPSSTAVPPVAAREGLGGTGVSPVEAGVAPGSPSQPIKPAPAKRILRAEQERPWDLIDELEANVGGKISLPRAREVMEDFRPSGAARKLFTAEGGHGPDVIRQGAEASGKTFESTSHFLEAINEAAHARKGWREDFYAKERQAKTEGAAAERVLDTSGKKKPVQAPEGAAQPERSPPSGSKEADSQDMLNAPLRQLGQAGPSRLIAPEPKVTLARQVGNEIYLWFDITQPVPKPQELTARFKDLGHNVEFVEFGADMGSTSQGVIKFKGTAVDSAGAYSTKSAEAAYLDALGQSEPVTARSATQEAVPAAERFQKTLAVYLAKESGIISGTAAEAWADRTLAQSSKRLHTGIDPELLAAYVVKGAAVIERGVRDFATWSADMVKAHGEAIRPHLEQIFARSQDMLNAPLRQLGRKVLIDENIADEVRTRVTKYNYEPLPNETTRTAADRIIKEQGLDGAMDLWRDQRAPVPGALRTGLGQALMRQLSLEVLTAKGSGKKAEMEAMVEKQARFIDEHIERSTDVAQALQAFNIYALSSPEGIVRHFRRIVVEHGGEEAWTKDVRNQITQRANDVAAKPEGFQRDRAVQELQQDVSRITGLKWWELPLAFWYAHILSGPFTHVKNILGNTYNLGAHAGLQVLRHPGDTFAIIRALGEGLGKGSQEALAILRKGQRPDRGNQKVGRTSVIETLPKVFLPWKLVGRTLMAEDALFFKSAEEMRSAVASRVIARKSGAKGKELQRRTDELLGRTATKVADARKQATSEGLTGADFRRRVSELTEQMRPEALRDTALDYALRVTFNQRPDGVLGLAARYFNAFAEQVPAFKLAVPFTNIIANVVNESLHYFPPVGAYRALRGRWSGKMMGREVQAGEVFDTSAKAAVGLMGLSVLGWLTAKSLDEANPSFAVYGAGPTAPEQKKQLRETGWRPYSLKMRGRYVNYQQTPMAIPLAFLGNYMDALRWKKLEQADAAQRLAVAATMFGKVMTDQSWLDGLAGIFQTMDREPTKGAADAAMKQAARTATSFVVPNALTQIDQLFDPTVYDTATIQAMLVSQVPFVRREGKPALNVLGEPVTNERLRQFVSDRKADELWHVLVEQEAWIPVPRREDTIVGDRSRGEDYYRALSPDEFYDYIEQSGERIRVRLERELSRLELMDPLRAKLRVHQVAQEERARVKAQFRP